jgi:hypothetical protein
MWKCDYSEENRMELSKTAAGVVMCSATMLLLTKETQSEREDRELPLPYQPRRVIY